MVEMGESLPPRPSEVCSRWRRGRVELPRKHLIACLKTWQRLVSSRSYRLKQLGRLTITNLVLWQERTVGMISPTWHSVAHLGGTERLIQLAQCDRLIDLSCQPLHFPFALALAARPPDVRSEARFLTGFLFPGSISSNAASWKAFEILSPHQLGIALVSHPRFPRL